MSDPRATGDDAGEAMANPRRALAIVIGIVFIDLLGFGVIIPILPFYVRSFGVSDVYIGLLAASYSFMQFLFAPLLGQLSDRYGRRPVLMLSVFGNAVAWTLFGLGAEFEALFGVTGALVALFSARAIAGAMGGNIATAQAYIADITPPENRAGALGLIGAAFGVGFIFGPALGGLLASDAVVATARTILPAFVPATPFSLPSFGAAALSLTALVCATLFLPEPERKREKTERASIVGGFTDALRNERLRGLVIAFLLVSIAFSGIQVVFIPFAADVYGYDETGTALLLTYIGVLSVLNQGIVVGRLSRRLPEATIAVAGATGLAISLATLPFAPLVGRTLFPTIAGLSPALLALLVVLALLSVGNGLLNVALSTLVSTNSPPERQGSAFGVTQGAGSLGRTVGPPIMAALYVLSRPSPFVIGAVLTIGVVGLLIGVARRSDVQLSGGGNEDEDGDVTERAT